ncbi:MAG: CDP-alcohol phosphatidyltransferase family protein [Candidatus Thermoplasmatota archaeon]|nr:CDP-alcohol phosphatidyltransferase family protein [Euryarchaeota archaeon]MBU4031355.1 CDP-alcohol phosphatidyltransferase family protein [Candidatus Thermoplasmatota archaeon]MBU4070836.1 CDP-alcohol phosphatidyltransferase family protein [Candidatus Thermoplasmatota archaeon]MBU4143519.1 CDP-alcohol phosphatidyltransferase family protein [Candidatus Thermoplasmatota archaeon]MBU4591969.1 CDP-alcohol phosphatidyltransferase family protein [Candidatus Thermoplasmatota archaeon]
MNADAQHLHTGDWKLAPNILTLVRLILALPYLLSIWFHQYYLAIVILWIAGSTDMLDGIIARRSGQTSGLGQVLDLGIDRALTLPAILILWYQGYLSVQPFFPWLALAWAVVLFTADSTILVGIYRFIPRKLRDQGLEFPSPATVVKLTYPVQILALSFIIGVPTWAFGTFSTAVFTGYVLFATAMTVIASAVYMKKASWLFFD